MEQPVNNVHSFINYFSNTFLTLFVFFCSGVSTLHAIFISITSLYFVFWSDLFSDYHSAELITFRNSPVSTFALGVSVGYFISDLGMICWLYPSLGGVEYVIHHSLSAIAVSYSMLTGEGQLYTFMVLISEVTTPEINMRWYLDIAGLKRSNAYLINGIVIFFAWLVMRMHTFGYLLVYCVPSALATMNLIWFGKILKGIIKTIAKKQ
ncbi:transmembrane 56-like isoform X1 [Olea europaea subsp. europaea]|uniref:Transmembrane 56-like isoform X1 n=1 Tax=Olea europaea subsp. europaea TaxID=158383 RepID=A0A8S0RY30_OLEEU|nr:transmembrane 56-like isoform X1 [Olea europaea subsp. europaea]